MGETRRSDCGMIVEVEQGKLQGAEQQSVLTGKPYYSFLGIPYGKPPLGDLRFRPPIPSEQWDGILDAKSETTPCIQRETSTNQTCGSEDCLYLNVHTPAPPSEIKIPKAVMVYIHGGGYFESSGLDTNCSADHLINYDIVFVTVNYRLHALGFLNLGLADCPGNCGLKDQALALRWIKKNISQFGGDSENITVAGLSAGACCVHWHMLSPISKGLFHKAILESGTRGCTWSLINNPTEIAFKFGSQLGFRGNDSKELLRFLKKIPADIITDAARTLMATIAKETPGIAMAVIFGPSIEVLQDGAFIADTPENLIKTANNVPIITGICNKEGKLINYVCSGEFLETLKHDIYPLIKYNYKSEERLYPELLKEINRFYFGDETNPKITVEGIVDLYTDFYHMNFYKSIDHVISSDRPVYVYEFTFTGTLNMPIRKLAELNKIEGASHADEYCYLYCPKRRKIHITDLEKTVINSICTLWTNFAKTGNPTEGMDVKWKPHTVNKPCYLKINKELQLMEDTILKERIAFWDKMQKKFKRI